VTDQAAVADEELPEAGVDYDRETGEVRNAGEATLEEVADATAAKLLRTRPLTAAQIKEATEKVEPIPVGVMGWFAKIGQTKLKSGKVVPGARLKGQIVGTMANDGRFGRQVAIIVFGRYQAPAHVRNKVKVAAIDKVGRWMVGIDSTLTELPGHVGDVVDIEMQQKGGPGTTLPRHVYERVDIWPLDMLTVPAPE
jgi:hypothetical protein